MAMQGFQTLDNPVVVTDVPELVKLAKIIAEVKLTKIGTNKFQADFEDKGGRIVSKLVYELVDESTVNVLGFKDVSQQMDPETVAVLIAQTIRERSA